MKTLSVYYGNDNELVKFIKLNKLNKEQNILIQIFTSSVEIEFIKKLQKILTQNISNAKIIGTTADGIIGYNGVTTDNTLISVSVFQHTKVETAILKHNNENFFETGQKITQKLISNNSKMIISFTDGLNTNGEEYLNGISSINNDIIVSGGMAGDNYHFNKTYIFDNNSILSNGAVAAILNSDNLNILNHYSFDWVPIGIKMEVTKSIKNRVYEINHEKAIDIYHKYLGEKTAKHLPAIGIEFPLIIERDNMIMGRAVLKKFDDGSLLFAGNINKGDDVRFGVGSGSLILSKGKEKINILKSKKPESIFSYSCTGRRHFIPKTVEKETKLLNRIVNTSGFFTYGEFFHFNKKNYLLNETLTLLALSEKEFSNDMIEELDSVNNFPTTLETTAALANKISEDYEHINNNLGSLIDRRVSELREMHFKDSLTKLYNRNQLKLDLKESKYEVLVLINIDDFRGLNGFYGGEAGDFVLIELSKKILEITKNDLCNVYRLNSDEFAILKNNELSESDLLQWIQYLDSNLNNIKFYYHKTAIHINITIGITIGKGEKPLVNADIALKKARKDKLQYFIYDNDLMFTEEYSKNIEMAVKIKNSLKQDNIIPYYQPIIDNKTGEIVKYEALVRLIDENNDVISPFFFLKISKKIRLYKKITKAVIRHSFKKFHNSDLDFSINLSIDDIEDEETVDYIMEYLNKYNVSNNLIFEIVETEEIKDYDVIIDFVKKIKAMGARVAIDDFGSGYSNFNYIVKIDADIIKIDGSLIKNIEKDNNAFIIVEMIVNFAKKINMKTLAEFVENERIFKIIKDIGIDYSQGYYFSPPLKKIEDYTIN